MKNGKCIDNMCNEACILAGKGGEEEIVDFNTNPRFSDRPGTRPIRTRQVDTADSDLVDIAVPEHIGDADAVWRRRVVADE